MSGIDLSFDVIHDNALEFERALKELQAKSVYVGFPDDGPERRDEEGDPVPITNAGIAYVQDRGAPELNIPARPFMEPGIEDRRSEISDGMGDVGIAALDGDLQKIDQGLHSVGLVAQQGIKDKIIDGPFEPLADSTLRARISRKKHGDEGAQGELDRRAAGEDPGVDLARPLNDTGQMRDAVTYVIRKEGS